MNKKSKRAAALYLGLVFAGGAIFGYSVNDFYNERIVHSTGSARDSASEYRQRLVQSLDAQLHLDDDQVAEILIILDDIGERWHAVRDAMEPEFESLRRERATRIMALLSPVQQAIYEEILEERERLRKKQEAAHRDRSHPPAKSADSAHR